MAQAGSSGRNVRTVLGTVGGMITQNEQGYGGGSQQSLQPGIKRVGEADKENGNPAERPAKQPKLVATTSAPEDPPRVLQPIDLPGIALNIVRTSFENYGWEYARRISQLDSTPKLSEFFKSMLHAAYDRILGEKKLEMREIDEARSEELRPRPLSADADADNEANSDAAGSNAQANAPPSLSASKKLHPRMVAHAPSLAAPLTRSAAPRRNELIPALGTTTPAEKSFPAFEQLVHDGGFEITKESYAAHLQAILDRDQDVRTPYRSRPTTVVNGSVENGLKLAAQSPPSAQPFRGEGERNLVEIVKSFAVDGAEGHLAGAASEEYLGGEGGKRNWPDTVQLDPMPSKRCHTWNVTHVLHGWCPIVSRSSSTSDTNPQPRSSIIPTDPHDPATIAAFGRSMARLRATRAPILVLHQSVNRDIFLEHHLFPKWIVKSSAGTRKEHQESYEVKDGETKSRLTEQDRIDYVKSYTIEFGKRTHFETNSLYVNDWDGSHDILLAFFPHDANVDPFRRTPLVYDRTVDTLESGYLSLEVFAAPRAASTQALVEDYEAYRDGDISHSKLHAAFDVEGGVNEAQRLWGINHLQIAIDLRREERRTGVVTRMADYPELRAEMVKKLGTDYNERNPPPICPTIPRSNIGNYLSLLSRSTLVRLAHYERLEAEPGANINYAQELGILEIARASSKWTKRLIELGVSEEDIGGDRRFSVGYSFQCDADILKPSKLRYVDGVAEPGRLEMTARTITANSYHVWTHHHLANGAQGVDGQRDWLGSWGARISGDTYRVLMGGEGGRESLGEGDSCDECADEGLESCVMSYKDALPILLPRFGSAMILEGIAAWKDAFRRTKRPDAKEKMKYFDELEDAVRVKDGAMEIELFGLVVL